MSFVKRTTALGLLCLSVGGGVSAHELNPGYLQLQEVQPRTFEVLWKIARRGGLRLEMGRAGRTAVLQHHTWDGVVDSTLRFARAACPGERRT